MRTANMCVATLVLTLSLVGAGWAHSKVKSSTPKDDSTVKIMPSEVRLDFNEGFEANFSRFRAYPLGVTSNDHKSVEGAAERLMATVIDANTDGAARADTGFIAPSKTRALVRLKSGLKSGWYAVMWRMLGTDTHTVKGFIVFRYKP